jgi:hypothetical protein
VSNELRQPQDHSISPAAYIQVSSARSARPSNHEDVLILLQHPATRTSTPPPNGGGAARTPVATSAFRWGTALTTRTDRTRRTTATHPSRARCAHLARSGLPRLILSLSKDGEENLSARLTSTRAPQFKPAPAPRRRDSALTPIPRRSSVSAQSRYPPRSRPPAHPGRSPRRSRAPSAPRQTPPTQETAPPVPVSKTAPSAPQPRTRSSHR